MPQRAISENGHGGHARRPVSVVIGAGEGIGEAIARRFSAEGHFVALIARNAERLSQLTADMPDSHPFACDVTQPEAVGKVFSRIRQELGPVDTAVYNLSRLIPGDALSVSLEDFDLAWRLNVTGALLVAREVLPGMLQRNSGNIVFIGATASRRGGSNSAAFSAAKAGQRALAESLARAYGPQGVHVSHVVVDGVVDQKRNRDRMAKQSLNRYCDPNAVADAVANLVAQKPAGWTFEQEVRAFNGEW